MNKENKKEKEIKDECPKGGKHIYRTDGQHQNLFCKKCFQSKK